jgi:RNA polymerase sigma factor (sigma-70 family)
MSSAAPALPFETVRTPSEPFDDAESVERLRSKLLCLAWSRYRVRRETAEDIVQTAFTAYLEVRHRYTHVEDQRAIVSGIFRNKCLAHIDRSVREARRFRRYVATPDAARENPWIRPHAPAQSPSVLEEIVNRETRNGIVRAIARLSPSSRRLVAMLVFGRMSRQDLIRELGLNKNTLDSRLHACRGELRRLLRDNELGAWKPRTIGPRQATSRRRGTAKLQHLSGGMAVEP